MVVPELDSEGGAVQFMHNQNIMLECEAGCLQEVILWRQ